MTISLSIFNSKSWRLFLFRLGVFALVPLLIGSPYIVLMVLGREVTNLDVVVKRMTEKTEMEQPVLAGFAYSDPVRYIKYNSILRLHPKVICLGSSRVMQFRAHFFARYQDFFNGGGTVERVQEFQQFVSALPQNVMPKVIIMGIDQWFFHPEWSDDLDFAHYKHLLMRQPDILSVLQLGIKHFYRDYFQDKKYTFQSIWHLNQERPHYFGFSALIKQAGLRNDGSYRYPELPFDPGFKGTKSRIDAKADMFRPGQAVSQRALNKLEEFLVYARSLGISVIGFLPPFAGEVIRYIHTQGDAYAYFDKIAEPTAAIFAKQGFAFYDFTKLNGQVGAKDTETFDGFHGSEKAYLRIFLRMVEGNSALDPYVDERALRENLLHAKDDRIVY